MRSSPCGTPSSSGMISSPGVPSSGSVFSVSPCGDGSPSGSPGVCIRRTVIAVCQRRVFSVLLKAQVNVTVIRIYFYAALSLAVCARKAVRAEIRVRDNGVVLRFARKGAGNVAVFAGKRQLCPEITAVRCKCRRIRLRRRFLPRPVPCPDLCRHSRLRRLCSPLRQKSG